eukprot:11774727-Ditylum_brightwellii.AAC.1
MITLMTNVKKVREHLEGNSMLDCSMLVQPTPGGLNALAAKRLNLIANYNSIMEVQVASLTFLKNSCSQALMHKIKEHMDRRSNQQECGEPMFFYIMMEMLSTMSAEVITQMKKLSLRDFEGKGVDALSMIVL